MDYVYDLAGKIKQVSDPTGTYGFAYDNMGRLIGTTTQYSFLPAVTYSNAYGYDAASNRTSFTGPCVTGAPACDSVAYSYDILNRLTNLSDSATGQFTFGYDALSRRTSLARPNGVNTSYTYDSLSRLLSVLHQAGTVTLDGASYTYDNAGNRVSKTNSLNNTTENYTYDPLYQLTQVAQGLTTTESYTYDTVGNRLSSLGMTPYAYNSSNELTSTPSATLTYDADGNTLTKVDSSGTTTYGWDFENRLTSVALPGTAGTVTFKYDPFGRRIQKSSSSGTTNYLYDGGNSVEELDQTGAELAHYSQSAAIDEPLAVARGGAVGFYEQDGLGSVTSLTASTGIVLNSYTYDAYGNVANSTGSFVNPFLYTGRDYDPETGLRYYRTRYYESDSGRFLNEDPVRFLSGVNFYRYASNDPSNFGDPTGYCEKPKCFAQLKYRTVDYWIAKDLYRTHAYWYVQGSSGVPFIISAGPWPQDPKPGEQQMLNVWVHGINEPPDTTSAGTWWSSGVSNANCPAVNLMLYIAHNWPNNTIPYFPGEGPNSDTAAHYLGTQVGFYPPPPPGMTGWNTPMNPNQYFHDWY